MVSWQNGFEILYVYSNFTQKPYFYKRKDNLNVDSHDSTLLPQKFLCMYSLVTEKEKNWKIIYISIVQLHTKSQRRLNQDYKIPFFGHLAPTTHPPNKSKAILSPQNDIQIQFSINYIIYELWAKQITNFRKCDD